MVVHKPAVDTYGWDTVYAVSFPVLNNAITVQKSFPTDFQFEADGVTLNGVWKSWQLIPGGNDQYIHMKCLIESGTAEYDDEIGDLKDASLTIQVKLIKIADHSMAFQDPTTKKDTGTSHVLKVNTKANGKDPAVSIIPPSQYDSKMSEILTDSLDGVFQKYFEENIAEFNQVFSVIMLNAEADTGDFKWLKPTDFSYAVNAPENGDISENVFAVLCMVDNIPITSKQHQKVDLNALKALPPDANSSFLISAEKLTKHMLLPGAINTIQGSKEDDFEIGPNGKTIRNIKEILWGNFQMPNNQVLSPTIDKGNFNLEVFDGYIELSIDKAHFEKLWGGLTVDLNLTQKIYFETIQREDGKYVFVPEDVLNITRSNAEVTESKGLEITRVGLDVAGLILAVATFGVAAPEEAAADVVVTGTEESIEIEMTQATINSIAEISEEADEEIVSESAASAEDGLETGDVTQVQKGGFLRANNLKVYFGFATTLTGGPGFLLGKLKDILEKRYDNIPEFNKFSDNCIGTTKWPATQNVELVSVDLRNSLVIGMKLT